MKTILNKKLLSATLVLILLQAIIVFAFVRLLIGSQKIDISETKQVNVTVGDVYYSRVPRENRLVIVADGVKYLFQGRPTVDEYSVYELYNAISIGDRLSIAYYESTNIFFEKVNVIVDARTENEILRSLEAYTRGRQGVPVFVVILFSVIELVLLGIVFVYVWLNYNIFQKFYRNARKRQLKKHKSRRSKSLDEN